MKPRLTLSQGQVIRALGKYLLKAYKGLEVRSDKNLIIVEAIASQPWSSLTFIGERHHLVVRIRDRALIEQAIDGTALEVPGIVIVIELAAWDRTVADPRLTLDLLAITVDNDH